MIGYCTFLALISYAASAKPYIPHYDAQRGHHDSNLDHQYEINSHLYPTIEITT